MDDATLHLILTAFAAGAIPGLLVLWKKRPRRPPPWERDARSGTDTDTGTGKRPDPPS